MIANYFSAAWSAIAAMLGNHLWQSTLFAGLAGLLTLTLRNNHASARYWLWLAGSLKFLIPFSLLVSVGSHLALARGSTVTNAGMYFAMEEISQPFAQNALISRAAPSAAPSLMHFLPALLAAVWLGGFLVVLSIWYSRRRRISVALRDAAPISEGREVEILRRLERAERMPRRIEMFSSRTSLEPGIFGVVRPILLWPEGISERLEDAHLEAIIVHELRHVCRRDNMAAAIHMVVEAIFWFHPLVWWLGARMVEERERACDEEVLELGNDREAYAESILKVCEFCVESPLACVSGVTGADLKKRMVYIMTENVVRKLDFTRKLLLSTAGLLAIAPPVIFGLFHGTPSQAQAAEVSSSLNTLPYEVATVKPEEPAPGLTRIGWIAPDRFTWRGTGVSLLKEAYQLQDSQIVGAPEWLGSEKYEIEAKIEPNATDKLNLDQRMLRGRLIIQTLLSRQFKLAFHRGSGNLAECALKVAEGVPKLHEAAPGDTYPNGMKDLDGKGHDMVVAAGPSSVVGQGVPIGALVQSLSQRNLGCVVVDQTGLTGKYDFVLQWAPDPSGQQARASAFAPRPAEAAVFTSIQNRLASQPVGSSLSAALQDQLGLTLEPQTTPLQVLVIDHIEQPAAN